MSEWTKGKWTGSREAWEHCGPGDDAMALSGDGWGSFAKVVVRLDGEATDNPQGVANYHLLLAAPTMAEALEEAERTFRHYGDLHAAKPDPVKAQRNYEMADKMLAALRLAKGEDRNG
jgi:hypothetical protein